MITVIGDLVTDIIVNHESANYSTDTDGAIRLHPGGQANNVAAWSAREGAECRLIGKVGDDPFGQFLLENARKRGVYTRVRVDPAHPTGKIVILVDSQTGERSMITDRGANLELTENDIGDLADSKLVYLSGYSLFAEKPRRAAAHAKELANRAGIPVVLDPSSTYFLKAHQESFIEFLDGVTFLVPNYDEGKLLTGEEEPRNIVKRLKQWVPQPILKLGERGCLFENGGKVIEITAPRAVAVDATGAGDSFIGAFMAEYVRSGDIGKAAERAVAVSAKVVTQYGSMPPL